MENGNRVTSDAWLFDHIVRGVLDRTGATGWTVEPGEFWCFVRPAEQKSRDSGWKLHVSSTMLGGPVVLARAAEVLIGGNCTFKFARDLDCLGRLLSNQCERSSGGKFLTAYPDNDDHFRRLAAELDRVTDGLPGPSILSDRPVRPGSIVHYRYGAFRGSTILSNDGSLEPVITGPDGRKVPDKRLARFSPPPWAVSPFPEPAASPPAKPAAVLIGGRFAVRKAIRHSYKGGVYLARDQATQTDVVLKQARPHALSTLNGTDARDLLRHEAEMLDVLAPHGLAPMQVALFTHQQHLFLAEEWIDGATLHHWVSERALVDRGGRGAPVAEATELAVQLVDLVAAVHEQDIVLRDLTPNNIMVTPDRRLRLVDLEHAAHTGTRSAGIFTPGFAGPELMTAREFGIAADPRSDLFSLGMTLFWLTSGVQPMLLPDEPVERSYHERLTQLVGRVGTHMPTVRRLAPLILGLTDDDPAKRWSLAGARTFLCAVGGSDGVSDNAAPVPTDDIDRLITDGLSHIVASLGDKQAGAQRLWRTGSSESTSDPLAVQHGAAGVLTVLTRAARILDDDQLRHGLRTVSEWIGQRLFTVDRVLPGLYFGRSGTAWTLYDAARLLDDDGLAARAVELARQTPMSWPNVDICHGVAGAGMAQLHLWNATGEDEFLQRATVAADNVLHAAHTRDGHLLWTIPADFDSTLAGVTHYGFAHGVAGNGTFLLYAGLATGRAEYLDAARRAGDTLADAAVRDGDCARWYTGVEGAPTVGAQHWCNGSSGVGTFLIRLWAATGEERFRDLAEAAAHTIRLESWHSSLSTCHGVPGNGEYLLDLAELTGEPRFHEWASDLAAMMAVRNTRRNGLMLLPDQSWTDVTVGYATGLSGSLGFLLRLRHGGARWGMPDPKFASSARKEVKT